MGKLKLCFSTLIDLIAVYLIVLVVSIVSFSKSNFFCIPFRMPPSTYHGFHSVTLIRDIPSCRLQVLGSCSPIETTGTKWLGVHRVLGDVPRELRIPRILLRG